MTAAPTVLKYDDGRHAYWVDGRRALGASGFGKAIEDSYSLQNWSKRMVLLGAAARHDLIEMAAAHHDDPRRLDDIAEQALVAGKANVGSNRGTAAHAVLDRHDTGGTILGTPFATEMVAKWRHLLETHQLEVVLSERIVCHPDHHGLAIAGRFDRICRRADGSLVMVDVKTGPNAVKYPLSPAVQLWAYVSAPWMAAVDLQGSGEVHSFEPMPDLDRTVAYVAQLVEGEEPRLVAFDLDQARQAFDLAVQVKLCQRAARVGLVIGDVPTSVDQAAANVEAAFPVMTELRARVVARLALLEGPQREAMVRRWPAEVPPLRSGHKHTVAELERISAELDLVCTPGTTRELAQHLPRIASGIKRAHSNDAATVGQVASVAARHDTMPPASQALVLKWAQEAYESGTSISVKTTPTVLRVKVAHAIMDLAEVVEDDEDAARAAFALIIPDVDQPEVSLGAAAALLTVEEAERLSAIATGYALHFTAAGVEWRPAA